MVARAWPVNVRDLGGLPLVGGGATRHGVLMRGDAAYAGDTDPPGVIWPPDTVVDLREAREASVAPYTWPSTTMVRSHPLHDAVALDQLPRGVAGVQVVYDAILDSASDRIAGTIGLIGESGTTLIHCSAGKDRTGVVIAALLLAAGVDPAAVVADYQRTADHIPDVLERSFAAGLYAPDAFDPEWAATPSDVIGRVVDRISEWPGGPARWHIDHGADPVALDRLTSRLRGER